MNNFFDSIDRYKYGIIAALASYMLIFAYLQLDTYPMGSNKPYDPFDEGSYIETPEIKMKQDNIEVPEDFEGQELANYARDLSKKDQKKSDDYSMYSGSAAKTEQDVHDFEKSLYNMTGEAQKREKIRKEMEERKKANDSKSSTTENKTQNNGGDEVSGPPAMVDFIVDGRTPYQNNKWYVRNPGYTNFRSGKIYINIKVNQSGNVISAVFDPSRSVNATPDMIATAIEYAKKSRFNYLSSAPASQSGWISYTFQSQ